MLKISKTRWESINSCPLIGHNRKKVINGKNHLYLDTTRAWVEVELVDHDISPLYGALSVENPWEGSCQKKPWEYLVTAAIPCLNTFETLPICIELLRLQTVRPYIIIIDTGSLEEELRKVETLRAADVEVHSIRLNGVRHPSDYPAMAMDLAFTLCRTEYLFATHADCFVRKRTLIEEFVGLCKEKSPAVGYELSPRSHEDWKGMLSHTASMYHMPTMDDIGFAWSLRRLCNKYNIVDYKPDPLKPNWPDTEILGNYILRENNITPFLVGPEGNQERTLDENIDHFRSYTSGKLYSPQYFKKVNEWYLDARNEAMKRIEDWQKSSLGAA